MIATMVASPRLTLGGFLARFALALLVAGATYNPTRYSYYAWVKSTGDEQAALVEMRPDTFFVPPYVGPNGWIGVRVSKIDAEEAGELLTEAWRMTATKRAVAAYDGEQA